MKLKNWLASLAIVGSFAALGTGCVVRARGGVYAEEPQGEYVEVEEEPPPPRTTVVEVRPGFVFIQGRWERRGGQWVWRDGYWERERVGHVWVEGRWERRGRRHVWVEGRWQANTQGPANGPVIRDHRDRDPGPPPPPPNNGGGPVIRDHH